MLFFVFNSQIKTTSLKFSDCKKHNNCVSFDRHSGLCTVPAFHIFFFAQVQIVIKISSNLLKVLGFPINHLRFSLSRSFKGDGNVHLNGFFFILAEKANHFGKNCGEMETHVKIYHYRGAGSFCNTFSSWGKDDQSKTLNICFIDNTLQREYRNYF